MGEFIVDMTGLLGFSRLKAGDKYEVALRYGKGQKWKSNGQIVKKGYQLGMCRQWYDHAHFAWLMP